MSSPHRVHPFAAGLGLAVVLAVFFTSFPASEILSGRMTEQLTLLLTPQTPNLQVMDGTPLPAARIGIVAGHMGNDSGAVCATGVTEAEVNLKIATLVQQKLSALGYETDLLEEFDPRLKGYRAAALVSIHNDSCDYINDQATGFKVAAAMSASDMNLANRLAACLRDRYARTTNLPWHNSVTKDMSLYHAFDEISPYTTAGIIETGFLNLDYTLLTQQPDLAAAGVVNGILCFINNESIQP